MTIKTRVVKVTGMDSAAPQASGVSSGASAAADVGNAAGSATRKALLDTAEEVFADQGIDAVSLRQIAVAAGQRNPGVVKYHFGTKNDLIQALIEDRARLVDERRLRDFPALSADGAAVDLRTLVEAGVRPLVAELGCGSRHFRFLAQLYQNPLRFELSLDAGVFGRSTGLVRRRGEAFLAHLPPAVRQQRHRLALHVITSGLADLADAAGGMTPSETSILVTDLIETVVAIYGK